MTVGYAIGYYGTMAAFVFVVALTAKYIGKSIVDSVKNLRKEL